MLNGLHADVLFITYFIHIKKFQVMFHLRSNKIWEAYVRVTVDTSLDSRIFFNFDIFVCGDLFIQRNGAMSYDH